MTAGDLSEPVIDQGWNPCLGSSTLEQRTKRSCAGWSVRVIRRRKQDRCLRRQELYSKGCPTPLTGITLPAEAFS